MSLSKFPSKLSLPQINPGVASVLEYLILKFPNIGAEVWQQRIADGKVHWHDGSLITPESPFRPQQRVYYYREVENETLIPFKEHIIFEDEHILVACKPHFLAVTPGGIHINECLQSRLRYKTGNDNLQAMHRLDRVTAGLVLFSKNPETRHLYHGLFEAQRIQKKYQAIALINEEKKLSGMSWEIKNRIVRSDKPFLMQLVEGKANSHSIIHCIKQSSNSALFELSPITGKTHQLRLHMQALTYPILFDNYYPELKPKAADDYSRPLQLLAKELQFIDPVTRQLRQFHSKRNLELK